jgi:hypothetical protein
VEEALMRRAIGFTAAGGSLVSSLGLALVATLLAPPAQLQAQWVQQHEQFYLQARHNWQFRARYQAADRLFNAFDFGHAILYETLWTRFDRSVEELEGRWYDQLTKRILVNPPHVPVEEGAVEIAYAKLAPEAKLMFHWAHILHRQIYDVLADERLTQGQKDAEVARVIDYYKSRPDVKFSSRPKSMELMQEQPYSLAFRQNYPKFNGLIWAYHWLQVGLYEPLLVHQTSEQRQAGVRATVSRFWQMLEDPPNRMPHVMPMTAAVAPRFAERYPEAAIIFDNLHSLHDVISDILANPSVPRNRKRAEILRAVDRYRDDTSFVMTDAAWRTMSEHMGVENMGGPAIGFLPELPTPTVTYGAVMRHDPRTGEMTDFTYGSAVGGAHAAHGAAPAAGEHAGHGAQPPVARQPTDPHAGHGAPQQTDAPPGAAPHMMMDESAMRALEFIARLLSDPAIESRIHADPRLHALWADPVVQEQIRMLRRHHGGRAPVPEHRHDPEER